MRAETEGQKRAVLVMIYVAWLKQPEQRLGQLIYNQALAVGDDSDACEYLFTIEDFELAKKL